MQEGPAVAPELPAVAEACDWPADEGTGRNLRDSDLAAVREFSLWNHSAEGKPDEIADPVEESVGDRSAPVAPAATSTGGDPGEVAAGGQSLVAVPSQSAPVRDQTISYIDRYAHLFDDDAEPASAAAADPPVAVDSGPARPAPRNAAPADVDAEHEESIEQYMARLMQRTRGQSATGPTASTFVPPPLPSTSRPADADRAGSKPAPAAADDTGDTPLSSLDEMKQSGRRPDHSSNLAALRSLANDIARQAIGTYAARKYRRTAVTQIIIATLAGTASLYLMLLAPSWWDLRCISAGVSLAASAYYLFLTITTLIDSVRASVFEELENDLTDVDPWHPPLPIDIERDA
jgi:hypothetical protein